MKRNGTDLSARGMRKGAGLRSSGGISILVFILAGCERRDPRSFDLVAPNLQASKVRFTMALFSPVGEFAEKRGPLLPFMDANGDGRWDQKTEAVGRCDRRARKCWLDRAHLQVIRRTTKC